MLFDKPIGQSIYKVSVLATIIVFLLIMFSIVRTSLFGQIDEEKHVYFEIVFLLFTAIMAEIAVVYLKQQTVIILMILGIILSNSFMDIAWDFLGSMQLPIEIPAHPPDIFRNSHVITVFAQLGAIILLFKIGLHSKIEKIFTSENIMVAIAGVIVPFIVGYFYAVQTGGNFAYSMFVGAALTATSVGVTVAILKEMNVLGKKFADMIIGAAIIDDVLSLLVFSLVINVTTAQNGGYNELAITIGTALIFIAGAVLIGGYFINYFDKRALDTRQFLLAIALMLMLSYVAEVLNLSAIVGAFLAGIILNKSRHYKMLEDNTTVLELIFVPMFFISLGMQVDVKALAVFIVPILVLSVLAVVTKLIGCGIAALIARLKFIEAAIVGIGMVPRGEVALIIASIGFSRNVLDASEYSIISAMALLTSIIVPSALAYLIKRSEKKEEKDP